MFWQVRTYFGQYIAYVYFFCNHFLYTCLPAFASSSELRLPIVVNIYPALHTLAHTRAHTHTHTHTHARTDKHTYTRTHVHTYKHTHIHACAHIHTTRMCGGYAPCPRAQFSGDAHIVAAGLEEMSTRLGYGAATVSLPSTCVHGDAPGGPPPLMHAGATKRTVLGDEGHTNAHKLVPPEALGAGLPQLLEALILVGYCCQGKSCCRVSAGPPQLFKALILVCWNSFAAAAAAAFGGPLMCDFAFITAHQYAS